ncbi:MAG: hypothetical protein J6Q86_06500 [Methanobrevibacter sp.]|nr:hypothetical protein [Methanobrevibacter sp.]
MEINEKTIEMIVRKIINELKAHELISGPIRSEYEKTEDLLKSYNYLLSSGNPDLLQLIREIDNALETISDDPYYSIIPMYYMSGETRESIAGYFDTSPRTITRQKKRLVTILANLLFSDSYIKRIYRG